MRKTIILMLLAILVLVPVGGVYARWQYADQPFPPEFTNVEIGINTFYFPPEQVLPGGDKEAPLGENHFGLIDRILNEDQKNYGLNISNNVLLHEYLRKQPIVYSNQKTSGGHLKFILDPKTSTHGLYYCIEKISDTLYYCYTFSESALDAASGTHNEIQVYRTHLEKTDKWRATVSYVGYTKNIALRNLGISADSQSLAFSIDVSTWRS